MKLFIIFRCLAWSYGGLWLYILLKWIFIITHYFVIAVFCCFTWTFELSWLHYRKHFRIHCTWILVTLVNWQGNYLIIVKLRISLSTRLYEYFHIYRRWIITHKQSSGFCFVHKIILFIMSYISITYNIFLIQIQLVLYLHEVFLI